MIGHLPQPVDGPLMKGRLGENLSLEEGQLAARLASLQMLASLVINIYSLLLTSNFIISFVMLESSMFWFGQSKESN